FVCGLNLVFLTTHLPTYLAICGQDPMLSAEALAVIGGTNCIGSLAAGWLGARYPKHILLGLLYILRAGVFTAYFMMPPTPASPRRRYLRYGRLTSVGWAERKRRPSQSPPDDHLSPKLRRWRHLFLHGELGRSPAWLAD